MLLQWIWAGVIFYFIFLAGHMLLWICAYNNLDNTVFWLLLSSNCTMSRFSVCHAARPSQQVGWEWLRSWKGTYLGQLSWVDQKDIQWRMTSCSAIKTERRCFLGRLFSIIGKLDVSLLVEGCEWLLLHHLGLLSCFFFFSSSFPQLQRYLCHNLWIFSLLFFLLSLSSCCSEVSQQLYGI